MLNLSKKQMSALKTIEWSERNEHDGVPIPLYIEHLPDSIQFSFDCESQRRRWLQNLEKRGLIVIDRRSFLRLTPLGKSLAMSWPDSWFGGEGK